MPICTYIAVSVILLSNALWAHFTFEYQLTSLPVLGQGVLWLAYSAGMLWIRWQK